jgi:hypothetical protein
MHRTLFALTLAAYLLAPSSLFVRFLDLGSGRTEAPASTSRAKEGPGLDPSGITATAPPTDEGPGLDPDGRS